MGPENLFELPCELPCHYCVKGALHGTPTASRIDQTIENLLSLSYFLDLGFGDRDARFSIAS